MMVYIKLFTRVLVLDTHGQSGPENVDTGCPMKAGCMNHIFYVLPPGLVEEFTFLVDFLDDDIDHLCVIWHNPRCLPSLSAS